MSKNDYRKLVNGLPINCIIRIKSSNTSKNDDIKIKDN
jgi:hypothetical protein